MKKIKHILFIVCILSSVISYSQFVDYNKTIGFTCGGSGSSTPIIDKANDLLSRKKYKKFVYMLYAKNASDNFIGVIACEKLNENKFVILSEKDLERINELYKSRKTAEVCGGCTFAGFVELSTLLENEDENKTRDEATDWINDWIATLNGR